MGEPYKVNEIFNIQFLMLPKTLIFSEKYKGLVEGAKLLYSLLLDRMQLSQKNGWADERGNVYIIYPREDIAKDMQISIKSVTRYMQALAEHDLIIEKRQGFTKPNLIYVCKPSCREDEFYSHRMDSDVSSRMDNFTKTEGTNLQGNNTNISDTDLNKKNNKEELADKFQKIAGHTNKSLFVTLLKKYSYEFILEKLQYMEKFAKRHVIHNFEGFLVAALKDNYIIVAEQIAKRAQRIISSTYQKLEEYRNIKPARKEVALVWLAQMRAQLQMVLNVYKNK